MSFGNFLPPIFAINKPYPRVSHQWFGNLVTMTWWTDLWLKEGFATFMMYQSVDTFFPQWNIWLDFITASYSGALDLDILHNSHPIEVPVIDPRDTDEIFDAISYEKGASVIRMLNDWIGDEAFRRGLKLYLSKHAYFNTCTKDLWASLEEASDKPVDKVMASWTEIKGFPLLSVTETDRDANSVFLSISQEKFTPDGNKSLSFEDMIKLWNIPIKFSVGSNLPPGSNSASSVKIFEEESVMSDKIRTIAVPVATPDDWVKLNAKSIGFYRTNYQSESLRMRLIPAIKSKQLSVEDRLQLVSDYSALIQSGRQSTDAFLAFISDAYRDENNYFVWSSIVDSINAIEYLVENSDDAELRGSYDNFILNLLSANFQRLGWERLDDDTETLLQSMTLNRLGFSGHAQIIEEARKRFDSQLRGEEMIRPNLRSLIYRLSARNTDSKSFGVFFDLYKNASGSSERDRIGSALGAAKDAEIIARVILFSQDESNVRAQDFPDILASLSASSLEGRRQVWQYFKSNHETLLKRYPSGSLLNYLIKSSTELFGSEEDARDIEHFFNNEGIEMKKLSPRAVEQSLENVRISARWSDRDLGKIREFLSRQNFK